MDFQLPYFGHRFSPSFQYKTIHFTVACSLPKIKKSKLKLCFDSLVISSCDGFPGLGPSESNSVAACFMHVTDEEPILYLEADEKSSLVAICLVKTT